ncbi:MAG: radical SAM protein [Deltaproteobacteria bacterium]|nr:radical SAM protein [Deltaproteobacteria bacterium]
MAPKHLRINRIIDSCEVLGPGKRLVVSLQGCLLDCPGCIVPETRHFNRGQLMTPLEIFDYINNIKDIQGITLTGGEPMDQAEALVELVYLIKSQTQLTIFTYTGYTLEKIIRWKNPFQLELIMASDILCDGPYLRNFADRELLWRGSSNQRIFVFSSELKDQTKMINNPSQVEISFGRDKVVLMGIPSEELLSEIKEVFKEPNCVSRHP